MRWQDVNRNPDSRLLRQFGVILAVLCLLFAVRQAFFRQQLQSALLFCVASGLFGIVAAVRPQWLRVIFVTSVIVTFPIGWVVSNLILAALFFGLMTPLAILFRCSGRDPLNLKPAANEESTFWSAKTVNLDKRSYFKQF